MKFTNIKYFETMEITDELPMTLIVENPLLFRNIICELQSQIENDLGEFVLSEDNKILPLSKNLLLITDVFNVAESSRQLKTKLHQLILNELKFSNYEYDLVNQINQFAFDVINSIDYSVSFKQDITLTDLIKLCDFDFDFEYLPFVEKILEYMKTAFSFLKYKIIVTVNLKDTLSQEEYDKFIKEIQYYHIPLLMIERSEHTDIDEKMNKMIIDSDLCIL